MKQTSCVGMISLCPRQVWWSWIHASLRTVCQSYPTPKIERRKRAKSSTTRRWIIRFRSKFVQNLNAWHRKCCKSSRSRGQRSRSHRDITCVKIRKIIYNLARDCSISLEFRTDFDHVMLDVTRTFKVIGSKVKVTVRSNVSA